jgi:hypothetical protein
MKQVDPIFEQVASYQNLLTLLQKNSNLAHYGSFNKSVVKLSANQADMARLSVFLNKEIEQVSEKREGQKINLSLQYLQLAGILNLIEGKRSKKRSLNVTLKKVERLKSKELIKLAQKAILLANKLGGFSIGSINDVSPNALNDKFIQAKELSEEFGLTAEKVKKLEDSCMAFMKANVEVENARKGQAKIVKLITRKLDQNARIYKNKIEKFVQIYEKPDSSFMKAYKGLRQNKEENITEMKVQLV